MKRIAAAALLALLALACKRQASTRELDGAIYPAQIPVYPGAVFEDAAGGSYYNEIGGSPTFHSKSWFFKVTDSPTLMEAFYDKRVPAGSRTEGEEGEVAFQFTPQGGEEGEEIWVRIEPGKLQLTEVVKAGKRKE